MFLLEIKPVHGVVYANGEQTEYPQFVNMDKIISVYMGDRILENGMAVKYIGFDYDKTDTSIIYNFVTGITDAKDEFNRIIAVLSNLTQNHYSGQGIH